MAVKFLNEEAKEIFSEQGKLLYRVMPVDRVIEILETKKWTFVSPTLWNDPFERAFLVSNYNHSGSPFYLPIKPQKDEKDFRLHYTLYCMCWTVTSESEAFWKTYSPMGDGIRISVRANDFLKSLEKVRRYDVYIGKANYQKPDDLYDFKKDTLFWQKIRETTTNESHLKLMLKKREPFSYENEIRIMLLRKEPKLKGIAKVTLRDSQNLIDSMMLDPRMGKFMYKLITKGLVEEFNVNETKISQSDLYDAPDKFINFEGLDLINDLMIW